MVPRFKYSDIHVVVFAACYDNTDFPVNYFSGGIDVYKIGDEGIRWVSKDPRVGGYTCIILGY